MWVEVEGERENEDMAKDGQHILENKNRNALTRQTLSDIGISENGRSFVNNKYIRACHYASQKYCLGADPELMDQK